MKNNQPKQLVIYQAKNGAIAFRGDFDRETIWGTQKQIAEVFGIDRSVVAKHIKNIFKDKELDKKLVCAKFAQTTKHGAIKNKTQTREVSFYNLDIILAIGYRTNSVKAIEFRKWATKTLKQYLLKGYAINKKRIGQNYAQFMRAIADIKALLPKRSSAQTKDILELVQAFANTWFSLEAYDNNRLPKKGLSKKQAIFTAKELGQALQKFKKDLLRKKQATDLFGQERTADAVAGIVGNVFQSVLGKDAYPTTEKKAAHLLYFIVKDHPFIDGNKRCGAFAFIWFLDQVGLLRANFTPEALTALTLLIAESKPKDKEKMIGLVLLFLQQGMSSRSGKSG